MRFHATTRSWSRRFAAAALTMAAVTAISACSSDAPTRTSESQSTGQHMTASQFSTELKEPGTIVVDVRTPAEYASGHLPQAQNIDIESPDFPTRIAALDKGAAYAVYCRSGNRSAAALERMTAAGFTHVYDLVDGIGAWQSMGGPIVMGGS